MYSSRSDEWETPGELYGRLHDEFDFQIDLAATPKNAKCRKFFTANDDALAQSWHTTAQRGWLNPPYSRTLSKAFMAKAAAERLLGFTTVMLLPARTDTRAFHAYVYDTITWSTRVGVTLRFFSGRIRFIDTAGRIGHAAPFPSMLAIFAPS